MGVISGKYGMVNGQTAVRNWQATRTSTPKKAVHSGSHGGPVRRRGMKDWTGSFGCYGHTPLVMPGDTLAFSGFTGPASGVVATNGDLWAGNALVDQIAIAWNFETGDIISHTVNIGGVGALTRGTGHHEDAGTPVLQECIGLGLEADGSEVCNITTVTLTITSENKAYANSCTGGWMGRKPGNIEATLAVAVHDTNLDEFVADIGDDVEFKLYVDDEDYWLLRYMHFKEVSGINVNREGGDIVGFTVNFELNGDSPGEDFGCICQPGTPTTAWWGVDPE